MALLFENPTVGQEELLRERMQSAGFVSGAQGWRLERNGDAEFNNVTVRGRIIGGDENGEHIEINGASIPNGIGFYTGEADESAPGYIQPFHDAIARSIDIVSPSVAGSTIAQIRLTTETGVSNSSIFLNADHVSTSQGWHYVGGADSLGTVLAGAWTTPAGTFGNLRFKRDVDGYISLYGSVTAGAGTIFTLPLDWRPIDNHGFAVSGNNAFARISVNSTGVVALVAGSGTNLLLDGVRFPTSN